MGDERKQTFDEASKRFRWRQKPGAHYYSGISIADTYLLAVRRPAYRRHDPYSGFRTELENRVDDGKGKGTSVENTRPKVPMHRLGAHCLVRAMKRGNARGAKGAGHPRQDGVNGKPEELLVQAEAGRLPRGGTSRMTREGHVRNLWETRGEIPRVYPAVKRRDKEHVMCG